MIFVLQTSCFRSRSTVPLYTRTFLGVRWEKIVMREKSDIQPVLIRHYLPYA